MLNDRYAASTRARHRPATAEDTPNAACTLWISSEKIGTLKIIFAWPLRKDGAHTSNTVFLHHSRTSVWLSFGPVGPRRTVKPCRMDTVNKLAFIIDDVRALRGARVARKIIP